MFRIKICGITNIDDCSALVDSDADAIGLNFYRKSKRFVDRQTARTICDTVAGKLLRVGVFVNESVDAVLETVEQTGIDAVQLHGDEPVETLLDLTSVPVIRAFRCKDGDISAVIEFLDHARRQGTSPSAVLLDAYHPSEYGGTGKTLDPRILAERVSAIGDVHWVLAGGLDPDNVSQAIRVTKPGGVDTASGVEAAPGVKDREKIRAFAKNAAAAFGI